MTRAERRHRRVRAISRGLRLERNRHMRPDWVACYYIGQIGKLAKTRQPCSCYCCGNPRRHFGELTMQERRAA